MSLPQDRQASALAEQIEVTSEMQRAGARVLADHDDGWDSPKECVTEIFRAMVAVDRGGHRSD